MRTLRPAYWLFVSALVVAPALAQSSPATQPTGVSAPATQPSRPTADRPGPMGWREIDRRLDESLGPLHMDNVSGRRAFAWWSESTGIDLNINWTLIESDGLDPAAAINLDVPRMSAERMLRRIMDKFSPDQKMIAQRTDYCVEVTTRAEANRHRVLRLYDIRDLLPALRQTVVTGGAAGVGGSGFSGNSGRSGSGTGLASSSGTGSASGKTFASNADAGAEIARLIRDLVEPDVWKENGGESSIDVFNGHLLVRAPLYVQVKIGQANAALDDDVAAAPEVKSR